LTKLYGKKPNASVPNRIGGYIQNPRPLMYKPNAVTESILVYRKSTPFLLDENIKIYNSIEEPLPFELDQTNIWRIGPTSNKHHPAVFPLELCIKVLNYYSYPNDVVLDPFAGIGTLGKAALLYDRIPVLCEININYINYIKENPLYEIR
jgi:DNA modification methylase